MSVPDFEQVFYVEAVLVAVVVVVFVRFCFLYSLWCVAEYRKVLLALFTTLNEIYNIFHINVIH